MRTVLCSKHNFSNIIMVHVQYLKTQTCTRYQYKDYLVHINDTFWCAQYSRTKKLRNNKKILVNMKRPLNFGFLKYHGINKTWRAIPIKISGNWKNTVFGQDRGFGSLRRNVESNLFCDCSESCDISTVTRSTVLSSAQIDAGRERGVLWYRRYSEVTMLFCWYTLNIRVYICDANSDLSKVTTYSNMSNEAQWSNVREGHNSSNS